MQNKPKSQDPQKMNFPKTKFGCFQSGALIIADFRKIKIKIGQQNVEGH